MRKKIISVALLILSVLLFAEMNAFAINPPVIDEAGYLDYQELSAVTQKLEAVREKYNFDAAVVIEEYMRYSDAEDAADDIFDYNGYGLGSGKDGILLYISKSPRVYHVSTHGYGITAFTDNGLMHLRDSFLPYMRQDDYYSALMAYADTVDEMLEMAYSGKPYNETRESPRSDMNVFIAWAAAIVLPIIIAAVATSIRGKRMNTAVYQTYADSYMKKGSMSLTESKDIFVYSAVTRTERPRNEGGSSTHTSSSGQSHGGIGGSY